MADGSAWLLPRRLLVGLLVDSMKQAAENATDPRIRLLLDHLLSRNYALRLYRQDQSKCGLSVCPMQHVMLPCFWSAYL
jgi:hypothetical protein